MRRPGSVGAVASVHIMSFIACNVIEGQVLRQLASGERHEELLEFFDGHRVGGVFGVVMQFCMAVEMIWKPALSSALDTAASWMTTSRHLPPFSTAVMTALSWPCARRSRLSTGLMSAAVVAHGVTFFLEVPSGRGGLDASRYPPGYRVRSASGPWRWSASGWIDGADLADQVFEPSRAARAPGCAKTEDPVTEAMSVGIEVIPAAAASPARSRCRLCRRRSPGAVRMRSRRRGRTCGRGRTRRPRSRSG